jgi:hypothetical protein
MRSCTKGMDATIGKGAYAEASLIV